MSPFCFLPWHDHAYGQAQNLITTKDTKSTKGTWIQIGVIWHPVARRWLFASFAPLRETYFTSLAKKLLATCRTAIFDKTGKLSHGQFLKCPRVGVVRICRSAMAFTLNLR